MNASDAIRVELQKRYPDGEYATGALSAIAREFDVSRQCAQQIARELGLKRVSKRAARA